MTTKPRLLGDGFDQNEIQAIDVLEFIDDHFVQLALYPFKDGGILIEQDVGPQLLVVEVDHPIPLEQAFVALEEPDDGLDRPGDGLHWRNS